MYIIMIVLIWFLAPIVELGVIIALAVVNDRQKRKIKELNESLERNKAMEAWAAKQVLAEKMSWGCEMKPDGKLVRENVAETNTTENKVVDANVAEANMSETILTDANAAAVKDKAAKAVHEKPYPVRKHREKKANRFTAKIDFGSAAFQGTAALVIGVVLVVLAGAVFATTTWEVLPDICKVVGVLLFAGLFFGASALAERRLKLRRTGWAFYTLGSVFLFLTILALGYFEILGSGFVLSGTGRWRVLFAGSLVTEIAWCCGYNRFRDRIYTTSCLWGTTVCITFLLLALGAGCSGFISGLMIYAGILALYSRKLEDSGAALHEGPFWKVTEVLHPFAAAHFWCVGLLMIFNGIFGEYNLAAVLALAVQLLVADRLTEKQAGAGRNKARWLIPVILFLLLMDARGWWNLTFEQTIGLDMLLFLYLVALSVWDLVKKERFWLLLTIVGVVSQAWYWTMGTRPLPMLLMLAGYLYLKRGQVEPEERSLFLKDSCLMLLLGLYLCTDYYTEYGLQAMLPSLVVYTAGYAAAFWKKGGFKAPGQERDLFWDLLAAGLPSLALVLYYGQGGIPEETAWYLLPCTVSWVICYGILYMGKRCWLHLILAVSCLPLPLMLLNYRVFPDHWFYGGYAAVTLAAGLLARRYGAVIGRVEGSSGWSVDWYHILIGPILLLLAFLAGSRLRTRAWMSVYLILLALYTLQYTALPRLRKLSGTAALMIFVWAWWEQRLIIWPGWLELGMQLLPVAAAAAVLPYIWGKNRSVMWLQRGLQAVCLFILTMDALLEGTVDRALLLEAVCLVIFLGSHAKKSVWWRRVSGVVLVTVALYMTKAFWLSISWWVYLLAAGLGLILFAAFGEKRRQEKEKDFDRQ